MEVRNKCWAVRNWCTFSPIPLSVDPNESVEDPLPVKSPHVEGPSSPFSDPDPSYLLEDDHNKGSGNDFAGVLSIDKAPDASGIDESPSESITKKRKSLNTPEARVRAMYHLPAILNVFQETHRDSLGPMTILENAVKKECGS